MTKQFDSKAGLAEKKTEFIPLSPNAYAYNPQGDAKSRVIIGILARSLDKSRKDCVSSG